MHTTDVGAGLNDFRCFVTKSMISAEWKIRAWRDYMRLFYRSEPEGGKTNEWVFQCAENLIKIAKRLAFPEGGFAGLRVKPMDVSAGN